MTTQCIQTCSQDAAESATATGALDALVDGTGSDELVDGTGTGSNCCDIGCAGGSAWLSPDS